MSDHHSPNILSPGYLCGWLLAVLESNNPALHAEHLYLSASWYPGRILGPLLPKTIDGLLGERLALLLEQLGPLPDTLAPDEQLQFAQGYWQYRNRIGVPIRLPEAEYTVLADLAHMQLLSTWICDRAVWLTRSQVEAWAVQREPGRSRVITLQVRGIVFIRAERLQVRLHQLLHTASWVLAAERTGRATGQCAEVSR